jgi:hypothetical protein
MLGEGSEDQVMATHVSGDDACEDAPIHESIPASSQINLETPSQAHGQADVDQGVYILSTTGSLDNLMQPEGTPANNPSVDSGQSSSGPYEEPPKMRMIGDYDDGANSLWTLYGKESKSHDQSRIQTLKEDMDGVLIFVRSHPYFYLCCALIHHPIGWSILCCAHRIHCQ